MATRAALHAYAKHHSASPRELLTTLLRHRSSASASRAKLQFHGKGNNAAIVCKKQAGASIDRIAQLARASYGLLRPRLIRTTFSLGSFSDRVNTWPAVLPTYGIDLDLIVARSSTRTSNFSDSSTSQLLQSLPHLLPSPSCDCILLAFLSISICILYISLFLQWDSLQSKSQ